ncbi:TIGR03986 family CRISPR-associated RAMP protein [Neiella sp. HB171785]|uniref:TIGR03986 family CRISPR-associated RAMP protein n=1 Tax=Neiella litorisoli TaxID=2771431 RepID=A0A8J6QJK0_9GAMM|nr:TIGR03986 family CRISPR-associated RAMP protein [Neiella litorisoli]MBD1389276.1 TIGR03986 family CRISPR-associated RAMP protein [Neiella litorisoli]
MSLVHAPYNFIPLSSWVHMPSWAHLVSHDHPFKDGISGVLDLEIEAESHICVGSSNSKSGRVSWLKSPKNGNECKIIPGSSISGVIRSIVEVSTFGKMSLFENKLFSYRTPDQPEYEKFLADSECYTGWLQFDTSLDSWVIKKCDYKRVALNKVNKYLKRIDKNLYISDRQGEYAAKRYKSSLIDSEQPRLYWVGYDKKIGDPIEHVGSELIDHGKYNGCLVFVGYNHKNKNGDQYVFDKPGEQTFAISDDVYEGFLKSLNTKESKETYDFLLDANDSSGIPVFYFQKEQGVFHIGLSQMPHVLYQYDINKAVRNNQVFCQNDAVFDFAELIFGTTRKVVGELSLKGRISFSDAFCINEDDYGAEDHRVTLLTPSAKFIGGYLEHGNSRGYVDYNNENVKARGWKRYPVKQKLYDYVSGSDKQTQYLECLSPASKFKSKLRFHNLKPEELGAIIWALTWGGDDAARHQIGAGKPLGYGICKISVKEESGSVLSNNGSNCSLEQYVALFEAYMNKQSERYSTTLWHESSQVALLKSMATLSEIKTKNLDYMLLNKSDSNYVETKRHKRRLEPFVRKGINLSSNKFTTPEYIGSGSLNVLLSDDQSVLDEVAAIRELSKLEKSNASLTGVAKTIHEFDTRLQKAELGQLPSMLNELHNVIDEAIEEGVSPEIASKLIGFAETMKARNTNAEYWKSKSPPTRKVEQRKKWKDRKKQQQVLNEALS